MQPVEAKSQGFGSVCAIKIVFKNSYQFDCHSETLSAVPVGTVQFSGLRLRDFGAGGITSWAACHSGLGELLGCRLTLWFD